MKKRGFMGLLAAGLLAGLLLPASVPVLAAVPDWDNPDEYDEYTLFAGQDIDVGVVKVANDENYLYVKYETVEGWEMTETHLHVGCNLDDFPLNKKGNPRVGHFEYGEPLDPAATEWTQMISLAGLDCDSVVIAAHAVVTDAPTGQATGEIYGTRISGGTKGLYEIDVVNSTVTPLKTITGGAADVNNGTGYTNGLAYDPASNKLYFTAPPRVNTSPSPLWSYDIDADVLQWLGDLPGSVVSGSFYQGYYYYIAEGDNTLWRVDVSGGPLSPALVFSGFGVAPSFTFGDIAISCTGMLYGSTRVSPRMFFSLDLNSVAGDYQVFAGSNALDLQLAYGSNGILYGANHGSGKFYSADETTGSATQVPLVAAGFADLASGTLFVPSMETAWAAGERFVSKGNWATYFEYCVKDWVFVEAVTVPANDMDGVDSSALPAGNYEFRVGGTWQDTSLVGHYNDAEYVTFDGWSTHMDGTYNWGANQKDLQVNGAFVDWGSFSEGHSYSLTFVADGSAVNFRIYDGKANEIPTPEPGPAPWYGDNEGSLTVDIYSWTCSSADGSQNSAPNVVKPDSKGKSEGKGKGKGK